MRLARLRSVLLLAVAAGAAVLTLGLGPAGLAERLELLTVDARFELRGERPMDDYVIVGIDDVTFGDLRERFPFDRRRFAEVLERVSQDGPRLIVYDVQFTEASGTSNAAIAADNALLRAARRAGNVVFSTTEVADDGSTNVFGGPRGQEYARATVGNGLIPEGSGGVLRRLQYDVDGLESLPVAAARRLGERVDRTAFGSDGAWIDFAGPAGHVRHLSFSRVRDGEFEPGAFRDRVVVIGATAPVLQDQHPVSWPGPSMPGPEVHANAVDTLLRGIPLRSLPGWVDALLAVALAATGPLAGLRLRPRTGLLMAAALAAVYAGAVHVAFTQGRVVGLVAPLVGLAAGALGTFGVHYLTTSLERARVRELFARFVPDSVVSQVLAHADREDPRLGGVRLVSTVMFSDLRGFTSFAEAREPELVIEVLNSYLTLMSDAILDHGGTLVAYMGDGIFAVFGAPVSSDDHADRALAAAREMLRRLDEFNAWMRAEGLGDGFKMGIGLNTGGVMSGNVGSQRRLEYAAIGDTTNTAARLEGMTKGTAYQLYVADSTREALSAPAVDLEFVDELEVRGRRARLKVWGLRPE